VELGFENRKKAIWAGALGGLALLAVVYQILPLFWGPSSTPVAASQPATTAAPAPRPSAARRGSVASKKAPAENLDPTLQLQLLASSEQTQYLGSGRNIFVSSAEIPTPVAPAVTDAAKKAEEEKKWAPPVVPQAPPIPLKFFGFANRPGEPKKIFLALGEDVWVVGEGEIVNRRYKVIRISPNSVEMQDVLNSGPTQMIPLTQG